jgi:hypothetical protein
MPNPMANNPGLFRFTGMWGQAEDAQGNLLAEVTEVSATAEINRMEVPLVGTNRQGYKPGRITREGTFRVQKIDSKWEMQVWEFISTSLKDRRDARGGPDSFLKPFSLVIGYDDPDALGAEKWRLDGCLLWRLPLGFNIGDDIKDLEFPFSYENETPLKTFEILQNTVSEHGLPAIEKTRDTTYPPPS